MNTDTIQTRINTYLSIMDEVVRQVKKRNPLRCDNDTPLAGFSPSDIKEITTGISMSYKGQYGVYAPPVFGDSEDEPDDRSGQGAGQPTDAEHDDLIIAAIAKFKATIIEHPGFKSGAFDLNEVAAYIKHRNGCPIKELNVMEVNAIMQPDHLKAMFDKLCKSRPAETGDHPDDEAPAKPAKTTKEKVQSWKDAVHPKSGKTLGEMPGESLLKLAKWSLTADQPEEKDARLFMAQVNLMRAEKGWDAEKVLLTLIADCAEYDDEGVRSGTFNDADWKVFVKGHDEEGMAESLSRLERSITELVAIGDDRRGNLPKPSKKKGAVPE